MKGVKRHGLRGNILFIFSGGVFIYKVFIRYFSYQKKSKNKIGNDSLDDIFDTGVIISEHLVNEEDAFIIHQFLHTMEEPYKEVFSLRVFGELTFEKIGKLFGKSSGWARVTYHRARKQVIEYMEGMNNERD